jgi:prophage regulatory protein
MKFLRVNEVSKRTGYSIPHIWRLAREAKFPSPVKLGPNASAWVDSEITDWQDSKVAERDAVA